MDKMLIEQYILLYKYQLLLKEPIYIYLIQIFQRLAPKTWWEDFIQPVLKMEEKINFKYLDIADLLNVYKINWGKIYNYLDKKYYKFKYNKEFKIVDKFHQIRGIVAHANEDGMNIIKLVDCLSNFLEFAELVKADKVIKRNIEQDLIKYRNELPDKIPINNEKLLMKKIVEKIDNEVLLEAISCNTLNPVTKIAINRTTMRFHSMRTIEEIMGFFNGAIEKSDTGNRIMQELHDNGLKAFEDIKDEINHMYNKEYKGREPILKSV